MRRMRSIPSAAAPALLHACNLQHTTSEFAASSTCKRTSWRMQHCSIAYNLCNIASIKTAALFCAAPAELLSRSQLAHWMLHVACGMLYVPCCMVYVACCVSTSVALLLQARFKLGITEILREFWASSDVGEVRVNRLGPSRELIAQRQMHSDSRSGGCTPIRMIPTSGLFFLLRQRSLLTLDRWLRASASSTSCVAGGA